MTEDYKQTLNLPKTNFPMKANLPLNEPRMLNYWREIGLYKKLMERKETEAPIYILHDGPPYANGDIHIGHALNKILKDLICRYHWMNGKYAPYVPGWDCHGQPIEHQVEKLLSQKKENISKIEFRERCREYAETYIERQREQFKRLGVIGTWEVPYLTLDYSYEATNVRIFHNLYKKGLVYKGKKSIYWCYTDKTALAEAEIEYKEKKSYSIKVKFELIDELKGIAPPVYAVIWTTTPWTLPANVALAFHPEADYTIFDTSTERLIIASSLQDENIKDDWKEVVRFKGKAFEGLRFRHAIFSERESIGVVADFVGLDAGTGIVHIAPGHGEEDFALGQKYNLPLLVPVDEAGYFTKEAGAFQGMRVDESNETILGCLERREMLLDKGEVVHSYPHCWRCKNPVIFRTTEQWFISVSEEKLKRDSLKAIKEVKWIPGWSINRMESMLRERPDWCISRQRFWGVPIPIIYCDFCEAIQDDDEIFEHIASVFDREGADSWFTSEAARFVPEGISCKVCGNTAFKKEEDILDVWFESGISHFAVLKSRKELKWPAELYLEGSDQHRGWFQSSLLTSVGVSGKPPYKAVLTHGFVVDEYGRKMSKSLGNVIDPLKVMDKLGADILRLWVAAADYSSDIAVSDQILERVADAYRRIRNTFRFMIGNLYDFEPEKNRVEYASMDTIDRFILAVFYNIAATIEKAYEENRYHTIFHTVHNFCVNDLSSFYLDVLKDRLYAELPDSRNRRSTQTALYLITIALAKYLAPIMPFTMEEVWLHLPGKPQDAESIHLTLFEEIPQVYKDVDLLNDWNYLLEVRKNVLKTFEGAKERKIAKTLLESKIAIYVSGKSKEIVEKWGEKLSLILGVSQVDLVSRSDDQIFEENDARIVYNFDSMKVSIEHTDGEKCLRCWNWTTDVGKKIASICDRCARVLERI